MIEIHQLTKRFGSRTVVEDLSFSVAPGEVLGFLGPNGAGKSTTMKMLTGFLTPDQGSIQVCGLDVSRDPIAVKKLIGYLPEGAPSYADMTVIQFLRFVGRVRGFGGAELAARVNDVVGQLALQPALHQTIETLSKGFNRRVGLAQAILHDPKVLILDEPTDGLDPNQKHQVRELIRNLARDKIVIISTHILEEVSAVCSRAIIIGNGKILADGSPRELQSQSRFYHAITLRLADSLETNGPETPSPVVGQLSSLPGVREVAQSTEEAGTFIVYPEAGKNLFAAVSEVIREQQWPVEEFHIDNGRLEDVFRQTTSTTISTTTSSTTAGGVQ